MELTALLISLFALGLSIYSVIDTHRKNRASSRPVIVGHESKALTEYKYEIINKGNSPAFFKSVEWFWDGKPLKDKSFTEAIRDVAHSYGLPPTQSVTELGQNSVLATGERLVLGTIAIAPEHILIIQEIEKKGFGVRIVYESAFGEQFVFSSNDEHKNI